MPTEHDGNEHPHRRHKKRYAYKRKNSVFLSLSRFIDAYSTEQRANREQEKGENSSSYWIALATLIFSVLTFVGIAAQDWILHDTLKSSDAAARQQHTDTLAALDKTQQTINRMDVANTAAFISATGKRAWLLIRASTKAPDIEFVGNGSGVPFKETAYFTIENIGETPAFVVEADVRLFSSITNPPHTAFWSAFDPSDLQSLEKYGGQGFRIERDVPPDAASPINGFMNDRLGGKVDAFRHVIDAKSSPVQFKGEFIFGSNMPWRNNNRIQSYYWLYVRIAYVDVYSIARETCYYVFLLGNRSPEQVQSDKCNYVR